MVNDMHTRRRRLQLTSFRLDMKLGMYSVVSTIEKTAVDGKNSQLGIQQQLSGVVLRLTLHTTHTSQYNLSISYKVTCISSAFSHCSTVYMHQFSPCRRYLPSLLTVPTLLTITSHHANVTYHPHTRALTFGSRLSSTDSESTSELTISKYQHSLCLNFKQ